MMDNPYAAPEAPLTPPASPNGLKFKYQLVNEQGREVGVFAKKGELGDVDLILDKSTIPVAAVLRAIVRMNRLVLVIATGQAPVTLVLSIRSGAKAGEGHAVDLKQRIDRQNSRAWCDARLKHLREENRAAAFRSEECPHCGSRVDLTGFQPSPQIYCPYCESVATRGPDAPEDERHYHLCDSCGYYSRPSVFNSFYIFFLLAVVVWKSQRKLICHACMKGEAWKTLGLNVITLIGSPVALYYLIKAYAGGSARSAAFGGLDAANGYARKLKVEKAEEGYDLIASRLRHAAGIHYNRALLHARNQDWPACHEALRSLWADCSNYRPAYPLARQALVNLNRPDEAERLRQMWE